MWGLFLYVVAWAVCLKIWGPYQGATRYLEKPLAILGPVVEGIGYAGQIFLGLLAWLIVCMLFFAVCRLIGALLFDLPRKLRD